MKNIQYVQILKDSFSLTWKNRFLWIFGLIAFLGSIISNIDAYNNKALEEAKKVLEVSSFIQEHPGLMATVGIAGVVLMVAFFLLRIVATAAIIKAINDINLYKQLSVKNIFIEAKKYLWTLLLLEIVISLALMGLVIVLSAPVSYLFFLKANIFGSIALTLAIVIAIPLLILSYYLRKYAFFYVTLGGFNVRMALELAYGAFVANFKESLLMGILNIGLNLLLLFSLLIAAFLTALIFTVLAAIAHAFSLKTVLMTVLIIGLLFILLACLAVFTFYTVFLQAVWLLFFKEISLRKYKEKKDLEKDEAERKLLSSEVV